MKTYLLFLTAVYLLGGRVLADRTISVVNQCTGTIWPAISGPVAPTATSGGSQSLGWAQPPGNTAFVVPDNYARVWARTGCNSDGSGCNIGACQGDTIDCSDGYAGQGATLAEFTLQSGGDSYDVSMVDGFNLPLAVTASGQGSCGQASCGTSTDILTQCDPRLVFPPGSSEIWSCASACLNGNSLSSSFNASNSVWCCVENGLAMQHSQCTSNEIPFYQAYKNMCQNAYVYADDDNYPNAVFSCSQADYTITFCPGGTGSGVSGIPISAAVSQQVGNGISLGGTGTNVQIQPPITGGGNGGPSGSSGGGIASSSTQSNLGEPSSGGGYSLTSSITYSQQTSGGYGPSSVPVSESSQTSTSTYSSLANPTSTQNNYPPSLSSQAILPPWSSVLGGNGPPQSVGVPGGWGFGTGQKNVVVETNNKCKRRQGKRNEPSRLESP